MGNTSVDKNQLFEMSRRLFGHFWIKLTSDTLKDNLYSHPDYPALSSLADVCKDFGVEHLAVETTVDKLVENGYPAIAHLMPDGGTYVYIEYVDEENIIYYHPSKKRIKESLSDFQQNWSRVVFYLLPDDEAKEKNYFVKRVTEVFIKWSFPCFIFLLFLAGIYPVLKIDTNLPILFIPLFIIKIIGLLISINLIKHSLGELSSFWNKLCQTDEKSSCDDVLSSPAATLFGLISMSDIGLIYFSVGIVSMIFSLYVGIVQQNLTLLFIISLFSVPYVLFSVSYQAFKIKKWCPLCLSVMSILVIESILGILHIALVTYSWPGLSDIGYLAFWIIFITSIWIPLKSILKKSQERDQYKYNYVRLKRNYNIYNAQLLATPSTDMVFGGKEIIVGNCEAPLIITTVINTHCGPCATAHKKISKVVDQYPQQVALRIRFMVPEYNQEEALYLMGIYQDRGQIAFKNALDEWFIAKDFNLLKAKYSIEEQTTQFLQDLKYHRNWGEENHVSYTPTIFLNDKKMTENYTIDDIEYLTRNILENKE